MVQDLQEGCTYGRRPCADQLQIVIVVSEQNGVEIGTFDGILCMCALACDKLLTASAQRAL